MFGFAQRVHIPSSRTAQHAALAHQARTAPSKLESREGCLHQWRALPENFELNSGSMSKDMRVLMRKDLQQSSSFDSCWCWSVFAASTVVFVSLESSEVVPQTVVSRHGVGTHERIGRASFQLD